MLAATEPPKPVEEVEATLSDGIWTSTWDNPAMGGLYALNVAERADSNTNGWLTEYHELQMRSLAAAPDITGVPSAALYAMNSAENAEFGDTIKVTSFGLKLAPQMASIPAGGVSQVWLERDPASPLQSFQPLLGTARVRLHPDVRVVPIRVIVLCDADGIPPKAKMPFRATPTKTSKQRRSSTP